jgi:homogentisate 1,2-dioxygenase
VPHGPDEEAFDKASHAELKPHKLDATLAFMFETRWPLKPTAWALRDAPLETTYAACWQGLKDEFTA